jgi:hypothetical protein
MVEMFLFVVVEIVVGKRNCEQGWKHPKLFQRTRRTSISFARRRNSRSSVGYGLHHSEILV